MHKKLLVALSAVGILTLAGCGESKSSYPDLNPPLSGDYVADFSQGESEEIFASDGWSNGQPFNAVWKKENISYADGKMELTIKNEDVTVVEDEQEVTYPYSAAESRTHKLYGYGDFQVRMKPSKAYGSVTTFFTYTDEWNKTGGVANKHDEIDIEFLGKDTTKVQFHYYVGGVSYPEYMYDLGFDASLEFHTYGFRWEEDCISWTVDGKTAYQVKGDTTNLPSMPGRIMTSYWPSSAAKWSGLYTETNDTSCEYEWIKSNAPTSYADGEEPVPAFDEDVNWDEIDAIDTEFVNAWDNDYTITKDPQDSTSTTVTYDRIGGWKQVKSSDAARYAKHADTVVVTLKNNSTRDIDARMDVQGDHSTSTGEVSSKDCLNIQAYSNETTVTTDLDWGGSKFVIPANKEATVHVNFDNESETMGEPKSLLFFFDSMQDGYIDVPGSSVTIKDIKFANLDGTPVTPDPKPEPPTPQPGDSVKLVFNTENDYTLDPKGVATESVTASYVDMVGDSYQNFYAPLSEVEGKTQVSIKIKNNGESASKVRVDVEGATSVGNHKVINASATAAGHDDVWTDLEWGGTYITVSASEEVTLVVTFDQTTERGDATLLKFFIDSCTYQDSNKYTGSVTFSCFELLPKGEPQPAEPVELTFNTENSYSLDPKGAATKTLNVAYENIGGSSYENFGAGLGGIEGKTSFSVTIKNNGETAVKARVDVQGTTTVGNTNCINTSAYAEGHSEIYTDTEWGGSSIEIAAGDEVVFIITFDQTTDRGAATYVMFFIDSFMGTDTTHSGNVTLSNFVLA